MHGRRDKHHKTIFDQRKTNFWVSLSDIHCSLNNDAIYLALDHSCSVEQEFKFRKLSIRWNRTETDFDGWVAWKRFAARKVFAVLKHILNAVEKHWNFDTGSRAGIHTIAWSRRRCLDAINSSNNRWDATKLCISICYRSNASVILIGLPFATVSRHIDRTNGPDTRTVPSQNVALRSFTAWFIRPLIATNEWMWICHFLSNVFSIRIFSGGNFIVRIKLWLLLLQTTRCFPQFIHHFYCFRYHRLVRYGFGNCFFCRAPTVYGSMEHGDITITIMRFSICEIGPTKLLLPMCNKNDSNLCRDKGGKQTFFFCWHSACDSRSSLEHNLLEFLDCDCGRKFMKHVLRSWVCLFSVINARSNCKMISKV